ncbi:MAG: helix-turn-helix domain-containing protein [Phycisphaerae bacterium]
MNDGSATLADRLRELRRRHFGAPGRDALARALGVAEDDVERWERGTIPPGEALVRICELTGEDLQWLLTGQASRSTVVISGARNRHRDLITRIAAALEAQPGLAAPLDAFFDLLTARSRGTQPALAATQRPARAGTDANDELDLIPILNLDDLDDDWGDPDKPPTGGMPLANLRNVAITDTRAGQLFEPSADYVGASARAITLARVESAAGQAFIQAADISEIFPSAVAVRWPDDSMSPMFTASDALIIARDATPQLGRPALVKLPSEPARCRVWLGPSAGNVQLGRVSDGAIEAVAESAIRWSVEVLYRVTAA